MKVPLEITIAETEDPKDDDTIEVKGYVRRKRVPHSLNEAAQMVAKEMNEEIEKSTTSRKLANKTNIPAKDK